MASIPTPSSQRRRRPTWLYPLLPLVVLLIVLSGCSLHRFQGPDDQLYIGIKDIKVTDTIKGSYADNAVAKAEEKLQYAPNSAIFGSSSLRWPFPLVRPYLYSSLAGKKSILANILRRFTSKPVWMREVSPSLRAKVAQQTLREQGYMSASVRSTIHPLPSDSLQARVSYQMTLGPLYLLDTVSYFPRVYMSKGRYFDHGAESELQPGTPFSLAILERDREAISRYLRQFGYYYLKPDYIRYQADTLQTPQRVALRTVISESAPMDALRQWKIGRIQLRLLRNSDEGATTLANDSLPLSDSIMLYYRDKTLVRPAVLRTRIRMKEGEIYRHKDEERTLSALTNLGAFSSVEFYFAKREASDSTSTDSLITVLPSDSLGDTPHPEFTMQAADTLGTLDLTILLRPDKPWNAYLGAAFMRKSNSYIGPGLSASIERSNLFGGGERLSANVYGSYEWQTGRSPLEGNSISINSYQFGGDLGITFPFILAPGWTNSYYKYPTSTSFKVGMQAINTLFVVDAMTGQDAVNTAKEFNSRLDFDGVVLTKLDGDTRGGAALSIRSVVNKPIKFVGTGEKMEALDVFHPSRMADRILGMGDIVSLVERAQEQYDEEEARKLQRKIQKNQFDFNDFLAQLQQIKKMGNIKDLAAMIPGVGKAIKDVEVDDRAILGVEAIILSMTPYERQHPEVLNGSRKERIAKGSGKTVQDVNRLIKQFDQTRKMMKMVSGGGMRQMMSRMPKGMPGMPKL